MSVIQWFPFLKKLLLYNIANLLYRTQCFITSYLMKNSRQRTTMIIYVCRVSCTANVSFNITWILNFNCVFKCVWTDQTIAIGAACSVGDVCADLNAFCNGGYCGQQFISTILTNFENKTDYHVTWINTVTNY